MHGVGGSTGEGFDREFGSHFACHEGAVIGGEEEWTRQAKGPDRLPEAFDGVVGKGE